MVAAGDPATADAGATALQRGGNAVDAAVAASFAAFVCELPLCSPLGGAVALVHAPGQGTIAIDAFARTPGHGAAQGPLDFEHVEVDFGAARQVFHVGRGSAAVPLALRGLLELQARRGLLPLTEVLAPAIALGRRGFVVGPGVGFALSLLAPIFERTAECAALCRVGERVARPGDRLTNAALAATLEALARDPGVVGALEADLLAQHGEAVGGRITAEDLARARVSEAAPVLLEHAGATLATMPGPSTGGVLVALGARLLEGRRFDPPLGPAHALELARVQELLLSVRVGDFDDRCRDPEFVRSLLSDARVAALRAAAGPAGADNPLGSTTHVSAIDEQGTLVAITLTNGEGSGHVLPGTGIVVNNLMGEEDIHPRGFHRDPPGRPLSTMMAPTLRYGGLDGALALGSGGSNRLRNAILQVLTLVVDQGLPLAAAVCAPRLHVERSGEGVRLAFERLGSSAAAEAALIGRYGPTSMAFDDLNMYFGGVHAAIAKDGDFSGAGDPRRGGSVRVV